MKIYVGWDSREDIAYQVCEHSIKRRDANAEVYPLKQNEMREQGIYTREADKLATTQFTFTRFFVPYLNDFKSLNSSVIQQRLWFVCNTITNQKRQLKWMDKYKQFIQEKIGQAWCYGTVSIQKTKY